MGAFNIFRVLGDICHIASKFTLMWAIHWNRSAEVREPFPTAPPQLTSLPRV